MKYHHALTDAKLRGVKPKAKSFKLADGEGLHVLVMPAGNDGKPGGAMYWRYNYRTAGRAKTMALGTYPEITLKIARERHYAAATIVQTGADPLAQRRVEKVQAEVQATAAITFGAMADQWLITMVPKDRRASKTSTRDERMVRYLKAAMGDVALPDLRVSHLADLLTKYENAGKYETRVRIQGAAISIMGFAVGRGKIGQNPFVGVKFTAAFTAPANTPRPAVTDPEAFGHLLRKVQYYEGRDDNLTGYALELLTLAWPRPGDVAQAEWAHFDLDNAKWAIPFDRLKQRTQRTESKDDRAGLPYEVPLSRQAVALLRNLNRRTGNSTYLFPGRQSARTMSENTMQNALNALGYKDLHCPHGFRSSASTILNAQRITVGGRKVRRFEPALIELQLDHNDESTRAIYDRGDCWDDRVELMQVWSDLVDLMRAAKPTAGEPEPMAA
jgi:integrase